MTIKTGDLVIVWEPGKKIEIKGECGPEDKQGKYNTYRKVNGRGPYHTGFIFKDTLRNNQLIEVFNKQFIALEEAKGTMMSIAMLAFRSEE